MPPLIENEIIKVNIRNMEHFLYLLFIIQNKFHIIFGSSISNFAFLLRKKDFSTLIQKTSIMLNQRIERKIRKSGKMKKTIQPKKANVVQVG